MAEKKFRHLTKKQKKQHLLKKNKMHEKLFYLMRLRRTEAARMKALDEKRDKPKAADKKKKKKKFTDKISKVRNRLTGKRRESKERWNRFAGTSGGGGRGL